jgi:hypothetical protein
MDSVTTKICYTILKEKNMYIVLTKNSDNTWDGISQAQFEEGTISKTVLDEAFETGLPITAMDVTSHKETAKKGATWNGTSFSGGSNNSSESPDDEFWTLNKRYAFLCDNKVVLAVTVLNSSSVSGMWAAAVAGETILVKTESGPFNKVGKTFNWDGTELTLALSE